MCILIKELDNDFQQIDKVQEFLFAQIKKEFGYGYVPEFHRDIKNLNDFYIAPKRNIFLIAIDERSDEIVATIGLRAYDKNFEEFKGTYSAQSTASIWRLFVDEKFRRCGTASLLFKLVEDFAFKNNFNEIYLHTHKTLDGALDFWNKMGFKVTLDTNNELQTVHMEKNICSNMLGGKLSSSLTQFDFSEYVILI